ncbi:MAG: leucine-rich repeat protein [Eubacteriales bacterium]|nr:leucine-rich repeat protein [Eubacteriales bacterium]
MKKLKQVIAMYLAVIMCCLPMSSAVFAADISENEQNQISDGNENVQVDGNDSVGEVLAAAISSEQNEAQSRSQSENSITGLEITGNTASVKVQTQIEADVVVAVYDEQQTQMLASGKMTAAAGESIVQITLEGELPQYFIASAYLLNKESHEALCEAYTTELYTKTIQDLKESTVRDYDEEKVLQLDEDNGETNFAVYNDDTIAVQATASNNQMIDHGDGTYTIKNAQSDILKMKKEDTFSYQYSDGTVLLVKIADISVDGTTVTIREDTDVEVGDYFDYIKIEADSSEGKCAVDNSNLEEGVIPVDSVKSADDFADSVSKIEGDVKTNYEVSYKLSKKINKVKVVGSVKLAFGVSVKYYYSHKYKYASVTLDYSMGGNIEISGKITVKEIPVGHISMQPVPGISVGFIPHIVVEASGKFTWNMTIQGKAGGVYDSNQGFANASSYPSCKSEAKIEGTFFVGLKATPYVAIIHEKLDKMALNLLVGGEISAKKQIYNSSEDVLHECKNCLIGDIKVKASVDMTVDLLNEKLETKQTLISGEIKLWDFYWSIDYGEFGWTTCPHICHPVTVTVKDINENSIQGKSILTVTDQNTGDTVEIRTKDQRTDSIEATDSKGIKIYLPNGDYIIKAVTGSREGTKEFSVRDRGTKVLVKLSNVNVDQNITWWIENNDTLYIEGLGNMPNYVYTSGKHKIPTSAPWANEIEKNNLKIKKIVIDDGIMSIGEYAFMSFEDLKDVVIPDTVNSIGKCAFSTCRSLCTIKIPEGITEIGSSAFSNCIKLKNIKLSNSITVIKDGTFASCEGMEKIELPETIIQIGAEAFERCSNLKSIEIPANVKVIGNWAFALNGVQSIYFKGNKPEFGKEIFSESTDISVFYPEGDSTWNGIGAESFGGTNVKWIPYHLNSADSFSAETDENNAADVVTEEFEIEPEAPDFESDFSDSEDAEDFAEEVIEVPEDTTEPDTVIPEKNEESDFSDSEEVVTVLETPVSYAQDTVAAGSSKMFSGLIPAERYVFVAVKNEQGDILQSSNLLYIKQGTADKTGTISFRYKLKENFSNPVIKIYGKKSKDIKNIKNLKVELSATSYVYNGSAKKPSVKITDGSYTLKNGTDYTVSYSKNINAGTAVVQITGKGSYTGSKNVNFSIKQANAKLEFKSTKMTRKFAFGSFTNGFKTKKTDGKISYSSNNTKVASVDKNKGQIKIVGVGKATITATAKAGTNYKSGKASFVLTVTKANNTIKADNITKNMSKKSQTVDIKASVKDKAKLTYSSNNKSVKVSSKGKVTIAAKFTGKATITIKAAPTARYNSTSKKITVTVKKSSQSEIKMDIFKKKSVRQWLERMCYVSGFKDRTELKEKLPTIVRKDFLYANRTKYEKYVEGVDMLVPKKVVHDYIKDTYGITVSKVSLPVKDGKYLLEELWWQDETQVVFDKAVKTKDGAKIILKRKLFGKSDGRNEIMVKPAKNSRGFIITSIKFYKK